MFYIFASLLVGASLGVVMLKNTVHNLICLVFAFLQTCVIYIFLGAEFLALTTVMVYVGAVAVLFLFAVMTFLPHEEADAEKGWLGKLSHYKKALLIFSALILLEALFVVNYFLNSKNGETTSPTDLSNNIKLIAREIFSSYGLVLQITGLILLVAMLGAIVLTFHQRKTIKRQDALKQFSTKPEEVVSLHDLKAEKENKNDRP